MVTKNIKLGRLIETKDGAEVRKLQPKSDPALYFAWPSGSTVAFRCTNLTAARIAAGVGEPKPGNKTLAQLAARHEMEAEARNRHLYHTLNSKK